MLSLAADVQPTLVVVVDVDDDLLVRRLSGRRKDPETGRTYGAVGGDDEGSGGSCVFWDGSKSSFARALLNSCR